MLRSVAKVTFELSSESQALNETMVILAQDTGFVNASGICTFYQVPKEEEQSYRISGDSFETFTGSLKLNRDTTVYIVLSPSEVTLTDSYEVIRIFPNPASDQLFIESNTREIREVELLDLQGKRMILQLMGRPQKSWKLSLDVAPGIYMLMVRTTEEVYSSRIVVNQ